MPPDKIDLTNSIYERFTVPRKYARPLANQGFEQLEAEACGQYVPGSARNLKVNVRITDLTSQPMLVPVWIMAYRYQDRVFRFLANGQTGRVTGQGPALVAKDRRGHRDRHRSNPDSAAIASSRGARAHAARVHANASANRRSRHRKRFRRLAWACWRRPNRANMPQRARRRMFDSG